jgi:hypothetical protein
MSDDSTKPVGYDTLREAMAVIIEHEVARASSPEFGSRKAEFAERKFGALETVTCRQTQMPE